DASSPSPILSVPNFYGAHGYDPARPEMSAIFFAAGPDVGQGSLPLVHNIDIAPTISHLLGVPPASTVQGTAINLATPATAPVAPPDTSPGARTAPSPRLDVLANASAAIAGGQLGVIAAGTAAHGTVAISSDGKSILYTPDPNYSGPDSFTYTASNTVRTAT